MKNASPGFTLVEALVVAAGLGVVSMISANFFLQVTRFDRQVSARQQNQRDARVTLSGIEREISQARGRTVVIDRLDASQPPYSRLTFSGHDGRTVAYYQKGVSLYRRVTKGASTTNSMIATGLRQVLFSYPMSENSALVSVSVTFERATYGSGKKSLQLAVSKVRIQNPDAY